MTLLTLALSCATRVSTVAFLTLAFLTLALSRTTRVIIVALPQKQSQFSHYLLSLWWDRRHYYDTFEKKKKNKANTAIPFNPVVSKMVT